MKIYEKVFKGNETRNPRTRASAFVNFLVKSLLIPVTVTEEKIIFRIYHWKTIICLFFTLGFYCFYLLIYNFYIAALLGFRNTENISDIQALSGYIIIVVYLSARLIPLFLSHGLQNMKPGRFNNTSHNNPKQTIRIILSFCLYGFGLFLDFTDLEQLKTLSNVKITILGVIFFIVWLIDFFMEFSFPLFIQILTEDFRIACQKASMKEHFMDVIEWYKEFTQIFQLYCFCLYTYYQFMFIFYTYSSFSALTTSTLTVFTILTLLGKISMTIRKAFQSNRIEYIDIVVEKAYK